MYLRTLLVSLLQVAALVMVGFFVARKGLITKDGFDQISGFLMKVVFPCAIIMSGNVEYKEEIWQNIKQVLVAGTAYFAVSLLLCWLLFKIPGIVSKDHRGQAVMAGSFSNAGFIGFPIVTAMYGTEGLLYAMIFNIVFNVFFYAASALFLQPAGTHLKFKEMVNPLTVTAVLALVLFLLPWRIPGEVGFVLNTIGDVMTPMTLILIGSWMVGVNWKRVFTNIQGYAVVFVRLIAVPMLTMLALKLLGIPYTMAMAVCVLTVALPVGSMTVMMSRQYGCDVAFANETMILSMILCIPTVFAVMQIANSVFV
ncbi:MAG: AEC family transporter [Sphaerochaetaceae bacterium]